MSDLDLMLSTSDMQGDSEWKNQRIGSFTSSKIHLLLTSSRKKDQIFGDSAMSYIYEKTFEYLTGMEGDTFDGNDATDWGTNYEDEAVMEFERITGLKTSNAPYISKSEYYGGSPDRYVGDDALLEIKCPYSPKYIIKAADGFIDKKYVAQNQSNLNITGRQKIYHATYDPRMPKGMRMVIQEFDRDNEMIDTINERVELARTEVLRLAEILKTK